MYTFFLNKKRDASYILESQKRLKKENILMLRKIKNIALESYKKISSIKQKNFLNYFGAQLNRSWILKKKNNKKVSFELANKIFSFAIKNGVYGGKLLGAGGGGYFFFLAKKVHLKKIKSNFRYTTVLNLKISTEGSKFLYLSK